MKPTTAHKFGAYGKSSKGEGHPVLFSFQPALLFEPFADGGGYPKGFIERALQTLGAHDKDKVLNLCSGSTRFGVRVDIREAMQPSVVSDVRLLPFAACSFDWIMADPPYSEEYAKNLYGTGASYPRPGQILAEASRVLRPGGRVGILHFQVPMSRKPLNLIKVYGVTTGAGYAIRAWSVFEKGYDGIGPLYSSI
jgi:SAM-dependent methyltransferase